MQIEETNDLMIKGLVISEYDIGKEKNINFLIDYSSYLIKNKQTDDKILNWQAENSNILKPLGLDFISLKKVIKF